MVGCMIQESGVNLLGQLESNEVKLLMIVENGFGGSWREAVAGVAIFRKTESGLPANGHSSTKDPPDSEPRC